MAMVIAYSCRLFDRRREPSKCPAVVFIVTLPHPGPQPDSQPPQFALAQSRSPPEAVGTLQGFAAAGSPCPVPPAHALATHRQSTGYVRLQDAVLEHRRGFEPTLLERLDVPASLSRPGYHAFQTRQEHAVMPSIAFLVSMISFDQEPSSS